MLPISLVSEQSQLLKLNNLESHLFIHHFKLSSQIVGSTLKMYLKSNNFPSFLLLQFQSIINIYHLVFATAYESMYLLFLKLQIKPNFSSFSKLSTVYRKTGDLGVLSSSDVERPQLSGIFFDFSFTIRLFISKFLQLYSYSFISTFLQSGNQAELCDYGRPKFLSLSQPPFSVIDRPNQPYLLLLFLTKLWRLYLKFGTQLVAQVLAHVCTYTYLLQIVLIYVQFIINM